ncbi:hypothetical protein ARMA_3087 [Ardenticatena maritima]|uniref:Uncharacterized protein n=1 Tax=Ardenticatena maritima TaxID=872965 RepID=A0A0M9UE27_9CHLR|nr:hypothetical protein ARMA_3087 [Ardenticatena maritima]
MDCVRHMREQEDGKTTGTFSSVRNVAQKCERFAKSVSD